MTERCECGAPVVSGYGFACGHHRERFLGGSNLLGPGEPRAIVVPRETYRRLLEVVRTWDAWLLAGCRDAGLLEVATEATVELTGSELGARMEEPCQYGR